MSKSQIAAPLSEADMLLAELAALKSNRSAAGDLHDHVSAGAQAEGPYTIGLALSGGGIRSATVSLGIMQKLAAAGLLKHADYLSTVSGGGYIGSALTWWLRGKTIDDGTKKIAHPSSYDTGRNFPFGTHDPRIAEPQTAGAPLDPLQYLRVQGKYLTPGNGLTIWSGAAVVLRSVFLNLMVWVPMTALFFIAFYLLGRTPLLDWLPGIVPQSLMAAAAAVTGISDAAGFMRPIQPAYLLSVIMSVIVFTSFLVACLNHSLLSWTDTTEAGSASGGLMQGQHRKLLTWLMVAVVCAAGLALLAFTFVWARDTIRPLFTNLGGMVTQPKPVVWYETPWAGMALWLIALLGTALCLKVTTDNVMATGQDNLRRKGLAAVLTGLFVVLFASIFLSRIIETSGTELWRRLPALCKFTFAIALLAYINYLCGVLVRHFLRAQPIGSGTATNAPISSVQQQYRARRVFEWFFGKAIVISLALLVIGTMPWVSNYIEYGLGGVWTALGLAVTAAGNIWGKVKGSSRLTEIVIMVGAALFTYGVLLLGHRLALTFFFESPTHRAAVATAIFAALIAGWFVNTNHIGLHRFYRDRLMEAFMPDVASLVKEDNAAAGEANEFKLSEAWSADWAKGPYHIINANMVLANSKTRKRRLRGGDNFVLSPLYIGSSSTQWFRTEQTASSDLTLASAMAISGAAANPRGAAGGRGLTRSAAVSLAMSLLNVRLGYWIPNPSAPKPRILPVRPNHFWPGGWYALVRRGYTETSHWLELADGGHFENLAIYELVRRRCGLIMICDGAQDNASSYADMVTAVQRVAEDFGATIHFDMEVKPPGAAAFEKSGPAQLIAKASNTDYPKGAEFADKGYCVGRIDYGARGTGGWPRMGTIIYMKSALIRDLAIRAKGYRGANHDFPNESTGDQFFDDEQFEAYREVGYRICGQMIDELGLETLFANGPPPIAKLRNNPRFKRA